MVSGYLSETEFNRFKQHCKAEGISLSRAIVDALGMYMDTADDLRLVDNNLRNIISGSYQSKLEQGEL